MHKTLLIFVDGLGLAPPHAANNPVTAENCPVLCRLVTNHAVAIDACLGVPGTPQSATGQTAMLTGINAPQRCGRHIEGFPGPTLRRIIEKHSIFEQFKRAGLPATFANGYLLPTLREVINMRRKSVTSVASLAAFGDVRRREMMLQGEAVCHDLIRDTIVKRGYTGPQITIAEAAGHLASIADENSFTLFEYFMTDRAGHRQNYKKATEVLQRVDALLAAILPLTEQKRITLLLTSDHGNIEDLSTPGHTRNPVPFIACGPDAAQLLTAVKSLTDITPAIVNISGVNPYTAP